MTQSEFRWTTLTIALAALVAALTVLVGLTSTPSVQHLVVTRRQNVAAASASTNTSREVVMSGTSSSDPTGTSTTGAPRSSVARDDGVLAEMMAALDSETALSEMELHNSSVSHVSGRSTLLTPWSAASRRARRIRDRPEWLCLNGRQAPTVFVLGCQKCGTTSLVAQMQQALSLHGTRVQTGHAFSSEPSFYDKEKHFFSTDNLYAKGHKYYLNHFPRCGSAPRAVVCDATPNYLNYPQAPERLARLYGDKAQNLTFVLILRDPAERTESYFYHAQADGWLHQPWSGSPPISKAVYSDWARSSLGQARKCLATPRKALLWPACDVWGLFVSFYAEQLRNWLRFFRADQFVVIPMARYLSDNRRVMADLGVQLGLRLTPGPTAPVSANSRKVKKHALDGVTTKGLRDFFTPYNHALTSLLEAEGIHVSPDNVIQPGDAFFTSPRGRQRR